MLQVQLELLYIHSLIGLVVVLILGRELFHFKKKQSKVKKGGNA